MGEVLSTERVIDVRREYEQRADGWAREISLMALSHEELRARLERAEGALREADVLLDRVQRGEPHPQGPGPTVNNAEFWRALRQVRLDAALVLTGATPDHCPRCLFMWRERESRCMACGMERAALGAAQRGG